MLLASMISFFDSKKPNTVPNASEHSVAQEFAKPSRDVSHYFYAQWGKRVLDFCAAAFILVIALPWIVIVLGLVALNGGRPVYSHPRIGKDGRKFNCLKVRTMALDSAERLQRMLDEDPEAAAEWARDFKLRNDPRITGIGKFLRKTSLDELTQIWNVLRGDMSLVGPRPVTETELQRYGDCADAYCSVRPGITGLWQVSGRNSVSYEERVKLDCKYVSNVSLLLDVKILVLTIPAVLHLTGC